MMETAIYEFREERTRGFRRHDDLESAQAYAKRTYAGRWIFGDGPKPFGFRWCCAVLDLEPERVRRAVIEKLTFRKKYAVKLQGHTA